MRVRADRRLGGSGTAPRHTTWPWNGDEVVRLVRGEVMSRNESTLDPYAGDVDVVRSAADAASASPGNLRTSWTES